MRTHLKLAESCEIVGNHRYVTGGHAVSVDEHVEDGILYLTFASISCSDFAETYGIIDMIVDFLHRPNNHDSYGNPHFIKDWRAIKKSVMTLANRDRARPIVLAGHGIGGAIALIAGYDLIKKGYTVNRVVTFGAPRSINSAKAIPLITYPLKLVTVQYVLPSDRYPKMFKFTRYKNINRTELSDSALDRDEYQSSIDAYIKCLEVQK